MTDVLETQRDTEADYLSMESQRDKLVEIMESEFGLPEKLLKMRALSHRQVEKIRYAVAREEKNEMILDFILQSGKQQGLMKALSESFQTHLVNYINSNGVYRSEFGLDWPLTEKEHDILNDNEEQLTEILDTCELLHKLCSKQVINVKQRNFISSRTSDQARNEALLGMIRRLSRASYLILIQCLKESLQTHIADILENGGVLIRVHATLETDNLDETETQIANEFTNILLQRNVSAEQAIRAFNAAQLNIIAVKRGQSIVIYICCRTEDELDSVCKMIDNSEMKNFLQQLFNLLTHNINFKVLSVKIYENDFNKANQIFQNYEASISQEPGSQLHKLKVTIDRHYDFLVDWMFPDFVLLETLYEDLCITSTPIYAIEMKETAREKNELIIKYLIKNQREEKLFEALDKSDQKHLVKYLENDGKYIKTFGGGWPIMNKETLIIQSNHGAFVDLIESDDLTGLLYQTGVINKERKNFVLSQPEPYEKNEALLEILKRCSLNSYWQIIRCLRHSKQCHIADILETGGVVVRVGFKLEYIKDLKREIISAHIVTRINNICNKIDELEDDRLLNEMLQLKLIGAKERQDVSLYFLCNQSEEVDRFEEMAKDGRLKEFAESFFNQLKIIQEEIKVTLKWTPDIFTRSRALIQAICVEEHISQWTPTSINSIPLELIDVIIQKSFTIFIQMKSQTHEGRYKEGFKQLAEVNVCWFKRMTKRRLKKDRWSYLSGIYERRNSVSTFSKNNRQFVEENVFQIITETNRLKNQDLLSDIECALIARKSSIVKKASNKATDIALILNYKNETNLNLFREYFGVRHWIFEAMRNCGTSVRVEINSQSPIEDKQITRFFEDSGSESLVSMEDRDFVRWIWCKSSDLKELQQSKYLRHPLSHLLEESPQHINQKRINLDIDQLKKKAMVLPLLFDESLEKFDEQRGAVGVTKLRNEFYCLSEDGEIKVFCDLYPFVFLRKFQLKEIKEAYDIVSSEKENALYILDIHRYLHVCVWKIEQNSKTIQSVIKWLELQDDFQPKTLSMSKRDQLLMVSREPSPSLRIYGPDAQLRLSISLHPSIQWPIHAVETSTGNFVILHLIEKRMKLTITTLSRDGKTIVHNYLRENEEQRLIDADVTNFFPTNYLSIDSNDRVFVTDSFNHRVILLDSNLRWNQIIFPKSEEKAKDMREKSPLYPRRLYYDEEKKQLVVSGLFGVEIVSLNKF